MTTPIGHWSEINGYPHVESIEHNNFTQSENHPIGLISHHFFIVESKDHTQARDPPSQEQKFHENEE